MSGTKTRESLNDRIEAHFKAHPGVWISFHELARIGGTGGWRTRVSDCRLKRGMAIENKWETVDGYRVSYYRYIPADTPRETAA